jgi:uncharacterized membrane protein YeaQ/YmgE (transglycosylase-associated protein family)
MIHMIGHILFGLIVGIVAKLLIPGHQPGGIIMTCILGMLGAWLGGFIGRVIGLYPAGHPAGFFMAVLGAIALILIYTYAVRPHATAQLTPARTVIVGGPSHRATLAT